MRTAVRRPGRPRRTPQTGDLSPAEQILAEAGRLFAERGFAGASTRDIAQAAGINQSTLFHHFATKEDILRELSERAWRLPLEALEEILRTDEPPEVRLHRIVYFHTRHLCSYPLDLTAVLQDSFRLDRARFPAWYEGVDRYTHELRAIIEAGVESGAFVPCNAHVRTMGILGMCNWTIRWYRQTGPLGADDIAAEFAAAALRSLLRDPGEVAAITSRHTDP
jgi:AcrR family transcriptional regulator